MKLGYFLLAASVAALPFDRLHVLEVESGKTVMVRETEKWSLKRKGVNFMDLTKFPKLFGSGEVDPVVPLYDYPKETQNGDIITPLFKGIDTGLMHDNLAKFTSFYTRYYKSETGYQSALWLSEKLTNITSPLKDEFTIEHVDHVEWKQFSIIVSIKGSETPEHIVVMGSHQDSMNLLLPSILAAPGADDDGSGTVTNLEALRLYVGHLSTTGYRPKNTVEFHFYSAEEGGLLGSLDVFTKYAALEKKVVAMLQQDMTGYVKDPEDEHVGVITDYTTPGLTDFVKLIIQKYLDIPYVETQCGYACSDHGSATKNGFPASFVIESEFDKSNRYIHSTMDTLDRLSFDHMAQHVRLVVGSLFELGNWDFKLQEKKQTDK
ncbi:unnamed protein product [Kluyveromyces dobzhanskii CBS 2104]|uniref:Peptide hydrolase n=1 Tax=Kluyveromyces dobzhanskii CBS 2104 TaxID=1427455 RepID=A0A0A8L5X9_9SACH|nr:unnamed protein product [Kluyveromyces dobzhanskii CBS 2104]